MLGLNIVFLILGNFLMIPVKEDLRRMDAEKSKSVIRESAILKASMKFSHRKSDNKVKDSNWSKFNLNLVFKVK